MSQVAPWLALAVDWDESEMWDSLPQYGIKESSMGERLAWICLLCEAKKKGRGGRVSVRKSALETAHRLTGRSVDGMLRRAQKCGAIEIDGDVVTLCNWRPYQEKTGGRRSAYSGDSPESALPRTHHQAPITKDQGPRTRTPLPPLPEILDRPDFREALTDWLAYKSKPYKPAGLKALVGRAAKLAVQHGVQAVIDAMHRAMGNGWAGWDQESSFSTRGSNGQHATNNRVGRGQLHRES